MHYELCIDEKREMHFAIHSLLGELWQVAEVVGCGMLYYDQSSWLNHLAIEDEFRQLRQLWQVLGRVGENEVKLARARAYKLENVAFHLNQILLLEQTLDLADEVILRRGFLHTGDAGAAT